MIITLGALYMIVTTVDYPGDRPHSDVEGLTPHVSNFVNSLKRPALTKAVQRDTGQEEVAFRGGLDSNVIASKRREAYKGGISARRLREGFQNLSLPATGMERTRLLHDKDLLDYNTIEVLSLESPRAFLYHNFLSAEECEHLQELARPHLKKSGVVNATTGTPTESKVRTSTGMFLRSKQTKMLESIERRVALWSQLPESHSEGTQILRYEIGQEYQPHFDYFFHDEGKRNNRVATVLMYLTTPEFGGETIFPRAKTTAIPGFKAASDVSDCAKGKLNVPVRQGDAILFYSLTPGGSLDYGSNHGSCPVIAGEKWSATKWIHVAPLSQRDADLKVYAEPAPVGDDGCFDSHPNCFEWSKSGECSANAGFMLESCRLSCKVCEPKKEE